MISTIIALKLAHAAQRLADRLAQLETRLQDDEAATWDEYRATAETLAVIAPAIVPGHSGELLTTKQMAEKLGISSKTLLKRKRNGKVRPALVLGERGRAALRWRGDEVPR